LKVHQLREVMALLGFTRLDFMCVSSGQGYVAIWDGSTTAPKLLLYRQTAATGALVEVPNSNRRFDHFGQGPGFRSIVRWSGREFPSFRPPRPAFSYWRKHEST